MTANAAPCRSPKRERSRAIARCSRAESVPPDSQAARPLRPRQPLKVAEHDRHPIAACRARQECRVEVEPIARSLRARRPRAPSAHNATPPAVTANDVSCRHRGPARCSQAQVEFGESSRAARRTRTRNVAWNASSASCRFRQLQAGTRPHKRPISATTSANASSSRSARKRSSRWRCHRLPGPTAREATREPGS